MLKNNIQNYGYKICYREEGTKEYIRYFITHTQKQAREAIQSYTRYPPTARNSNRKLVNPKWKIIPISKKENIHGIWRECPF